MQGISLLLFRFAQATCTGTEPDTGLPRVCADTPKVQTVIQMALGVIAILAVIFIVLAGLRLITSQGDPQAVAKSRQGIIYAVIGLVIALFAEVIVTFVINRL